MITGLTGRMVEKMISFENKVSKTILIFLHKHHYTNIMTVNWDAG